MIPAQVKKQVMSYKDWELWVEVDATHGIIKKLKK